MTATRILERTWNAPIAAVWRLWSTADGFASWYGPRGFDVSLRAFRFEPDGPLHYTMRAVDPARVAAMEKQGQPLVREVDARFLAIEHHQQVGFAEPFGPAEMQTVATFTVEGERVHLHLEITAPSEDWVGGAAMGWTSALDKLAEALPSA